MPIFFPVDQTDADQVNGPHAGCHSAASPAVVCVGYLAPLMAPPLTAAVTALHG
jgi:hypothetical protein